MHFSLLVRARFLSLKLKPHRPKSSKIAFPVEEFIHPIFKLKPNKIPVTPTSNSLKPKIGLLSILDDRKLKERVIHNKLSTIPGLLEM